MHLNAEELIDLAEGARAQELAPHLLQCESCREQLAALREAMSAAAGVEAPEPSPLFWRHFSERVREAVAAERVPRPALMAGLRWVWPAAGILAAALAVAVYVDVFDTQPAPVQSSSTGGAGSTVVETSVIGSPLDDPSLELVTGLAEQLEPEALGEIGWSHHFGALDEAVGTLTDDERLELHRLLQEALARPEA
jgi:hypothetical protein